MSQQEVIDRPAEDEAAPRPSRLRATGSRAVTLLSVLLLWVSLALPNRVVHLSPWLLLRLPVEALVVGAVCLALRQRARQIVATVAGLAVAAVTLLKLLDIGFYQALDRPFNPVTDSSYFGPAFGVLRDSVGSTEAITVVVVLLLVLLGLLFAFPLAAVRLTQLSRQNRRTSVRALLALGVVWALLAGLGVQDEAGVTVASDSTARVAYDQVDRVRAGLKDQKEFAAAISATDGYAITPGANLLTGLRGKDVVFAFVESYGQTAVEGSTFAPAIDDVLRTGTAQLDAAGFASRSAFLTSPTFGGISWLAHSTLQTGLWVENQQRYNQVVSSNRFTLSDAFKRAGWRTVSDVPSDHKTWTTGTSFYHYDQLYDGDNVGYAGPAFSYASVPDEYTLAALQRLELAKSPRAPLMAEVDLVSSHTPWTPTPHLVGWDRLGDGSIFDGMPALGPSPSSVWTSGAKVREAYGQSIQYSLQSLISFVTNAHDDNLVLVLLGDHQPATTVSGANANHEVPITIIAHDPRVLARTASWGWQPGMLPQGQAPVWAMDAFRNRFLTAFGPRPH